MRGRIETVLDWARARGLREGENPARWKGHLDALLPARSRIRKKKHLDALPYGELAEFVADLRTRTGVAALALEFTILTAARTGEVIGASWDEFDLGSAVWRVPAERMKAGRDHEIPLSARALEILNQLEEVHTGGPVVFVGPRGGALSNMAMSQLLKRMGRGDITVHGFRSTFRDWAGDCTDAPREVAEACLAHTVKGVEAAYRRSSALEKRRELLEQWSRYANETKGL